MIGNPDNEALKEQIKCADAKLIDITKPDSWNIFRKGNMEREMQVGLEKLRFSVNNYTDKPIEKITVMEYYALIEFSEQSKPKKNG